MEVLSQCKDKIREADIVLVGFGREFNIKREEIAVVISAIISEKGLVGKDETPSFTDYEEISEWAKLAVNNVAELGIVKGMEGGRFMPKGNATRAQTVTMLLRLQENLKI